jgi:hypothetical protein
MAPVFTYRSVLQDMIKVNWKVDEPIGGDKQLDFSKPFLPKSLVGANALQCLQPKEKRFLNQIRGKSYLNLFVLVETFIIPLVLEQLQRKGYEDVYVLQALLGFAQEEGKHIHLFQRFAEAFDLGFKIPCHCIGSMEAIAQRILTYHPLSVLLLTLQFEWTTQSHYLESVRDNRSENLDRCFCNLLRYHWMEEAQHTKLDMLLLSELAQCLTPPEIEAAIDGYLELVQLLDDALMAQVQLDLDNLQVASDRSFLNADLEEIKTNQQQSYRWTFLCAGLTHPNLIKAIEAIDPIGKVRAIAMAKRLS